VLSRIELARAVAALEARIAGHRIQGVVQPEPASVVLEIYGASPRAGASRRHLLLSASTGAARLSLLSGPPRALPKPPPFALYLRPRLVGSRLESLRLEPGERIAHLAIAAREGRFELVLAIHGRRSNVYLLDGEGRIAAALRPLEATRPELEVGAAWRPPASAPPREGPDRFAGVPEERLFEAIESHYADAQRDDEQAVLLRRAEQAIRKEARRLERKLEKIERELALARDAAQLERQGQLLKGALGGVRRGDREARVRDWESGEELRIALDPALSPAANLERLFKRYRKAVRSLARAGAEEEAVREARRELEAHAAELEAAAGDLGALQSFTARPSIAALLERYAPAEPRRSPAAAAERKIGKRSVPGRLAPRRYPTSGDLEIWVGRSDEANDYLTTRLARGRDLFFHLRDAPGSHVILRTGGRDDPPSEALLDACELAVHFSKAKKASRADVHVVPVKNVRKPRGAKPGLVMVHGGRTIHLRRVPARLQRLLASRLDD
jgi:predicted ribosome quality control (RQC) complex YloA/Tae2 family protein